jgi:hypothetical protein
MKGLDEGERRELRRKARAATLDALRSLGGEARRDAIRERALADGGFTPRELDAPSPDGAAAKYASLVDHQLSWALTDLKRDGLIENPKWGTWKLAGAALECTPNAVVDLPAPDRLTELRSMPYREYLRTPEWRRARAAALLRAGNCCSLDVTHIDGLEVHHRTYERLGEELANDLFVLCRNCHRLHHDEYGRPRREPLTTSPRERIPADAGLAAKLAGEARERRKPSLLRRLLAS